MKWALQSVQVHGGFLEGLKIDLPEGLTCIIGPRGSGKTTLAELLRFTFGSPGGARARDLVRENLGSGHVRVEARSGIRTYTVRHSHQDQRRVSDESGVPVLGDAEQIGLLPLDVFSSLEIEEIAEREVGERRRQLLDDIRGPELREVKHRITEIRRLFEANGDSMRHLAQERADVLVRIEERRDAEHRLAELPRPADDEVTRELEAATRQELSGDTELRKIRSLSESISKDISALTGVEERVRSYAPAQVFGPESPNRHHYAAIQSECEKRTALVIERIGEALANLRGLHDAVGSVLPGLSAACEKSRARCDELRDKDAARSRLLGERQKIQRQIEESKLFSIRLAEIDAALRALEETRGTLRQDYLFAHEEISRVRSEAADEMAKQIGPLVRVRVVRHGDHSEYDEMLLGGLKNSGTRNHEQIVETLKVLMPDQIAQILRTGDSAELGKRTGLEAERSVRVFEKLRDNVKLDALELLVPGDRVSIELDVSGGQGTRFKDAAELSRGQKCTALLPLLLVRRDVPLVIDQPEDNLDNRFVYETVVETIRRVKAQRQLVFVTHNANIPVLAEADLVIVMGSDSVGGRIVQSGTVEECKGAIVDLLEGGRQAFEKRRERYGVG